MKLHALAFVLGIAIAIPAYSQTTATGVNTAGVSTGGNNTGGSLPPDLNRPTGSSGTNAAIATSPTEDGSSANAPQPLNEGSETASSEAKSDEQLKGTIRQTLATEISSVAGESYSGFSGTLPVTCDVENGVATLSGSVGTEQQKKKIAWIVEGVPGVVRVENQLLVSGDSTTTAGLGGDTNRLSPTSTRSGAVTNAPNTQSPMSGNGSDNSQQPK